MKTRITKKQIKLKSIYDISKIKFKKSHFQMTEVLKAGVLSDEIDLGALAHNAAEQAEEFVRKVITGGRVVTGKQVRYKRDHLINH